MRKSAMISATFLFLTTLAFAATDAKADFILGFVCGVSHSASVYSGSVTVSATIFQKPFCDGTYVGTYYWSSKNFPQEDLRVLARQLYDSITTGVQFRTHYWSSIDYAQMPGFYGYPLGN